MYIERQSVNAKLSKKKIKRHCTPTEYNYVKHSNPIYPM